MNLRFKEEQIFQTKKRIEDKLSLKGKKVCFTGTLSRMTRTKARSEVIMAGGTPRDNLTREIDILIKGKTKWKTVKHDRASDYGIKIINESVFYDIIGLEGSNL